MKTFSFDAMKYRVSAEPESKQWPQYLIILSAALSSLGSGLHFAWPSPSLPKLLAENSTYEVSVEESSYLAAIPPCGYIIGGPLSALIVDIIGRKKANLLVAIPHLIAWIIISSTTSLTVMLGARFLVGIGDGAVLTVLPMYLGEISEPKIRGVIGSSLSVAFYAGIVLINSYGAYLPVHIAAYVSMLVPILFILTFIWAPETPYYYLMRNHVEDARNSLRTLRRLQNVDKELEMLSADVKRQISESGTFKDLFCITSNRKAFLVMLGLRTVQVFSGLAAFNMYTQRIFEQAGGNMPASLSTIIYTAMQMIVTFLASLLADKFGRKPLLIGSCIGTTMVLFVEGTYFYFKYSNFDVESYKWLPLAGMIFYVLFFCAGLGLAPNLMAGELFPANVKAKALCILTLYFAATIASSSKIFHFLEHNFGMYVPFYAFTVICGLGIVFAYFCVPETKGRTLEEIQQVLKGNFSDDKDKSKCNQ